MPGTLFFGKALLGRCGAPMTLSSMDANPRISLIFVNYQSAWSLSMALRSLFLKEADTASFEVIVVNNDKGEERALERLARHMPFRLIQSGTNIGFSQGMNSGAAVASGSLIGLVNPDTRWQQAILPEIEAFFSERATPTILGLDLVDEKGEKEPWSGGTAPTLYQLLRNNLPLTGFFRGSSSTTPLDWVSGGGMFLPRELFLSLGGFDNEFFLYFEDVDLCLRAKSRGVAIVRDARFPLMHMGGKSFSSPSQQKAAFYTSQLRYFEKHRPRAEYMIVRLLHRFLRVI